MQCNYQSIPSKTAETDGSINGVLQNDYFSDTCLKHLEDINSSNTSRVQASQHKWTV